MVALRRDPIVCRSCRHENGADARFCEQCAALLALTCSSCGTTLSAIARFCQACAHPVGSADPVPERPPGRSTVPQGAGESQGAPGVMEGERKQVTVLFADVKGSMELIADRDPEEAQALLRQVVARMTDAVDRYGGTVSSVMGDGILATFGAPLAHEDHALRACYAALQMQESVQRLAAEVSQAGGVAVQIRVGLNSGEVVMGSISSHLVDTPVGQTTHLAARMEQAAAPGSILITSRTRALAGYAIRTRSLGLRDIKGLQAPVEIHELVGATRVPSRPQATTAFVGRQTELAMLVRALDQARGGRGQIVAVVGEPGVGKSRLVRELSGLPEAQDCHIQECGATSHGTATPYLPVADLLRSYFDIEARDDARTVRRKVSARVTALDRVLEPTIPALLALLDVPVDDAWSALDPLRRRQRTLEALKLLVLRESLARPLLLVFEDLHWADSETLELLDLLVEGLPTARVLLVVTYRPQHQHGWTSKSYYTQLRIDPLSPETAREFLHARLGTDVSLRPLKERLIEWTEGNPFFLEESVRTLIETGDLTGEPAAYRLTRDVRIVQPPSTINVVIAARMDRLPPVDKRVLQCAAVVGKSVPVTLLAAVAALPDDELRRALVRLQAAEFLYEATLFPELEYTFRHTLTHQVAYESLLREQRRAYHRRILEAIERLHEDRLEEHAERLGHHAMQGAVWEQAVTYLSQAALKAAARSAHVEAVARFEQALDALARLPASPAQLQRAIDLRFDLRQSCVPLLDTQRLLHHLAEAERAAETLDDPIRLGWVLAYRAHGQLLAGAGRVAVETGRRALGLARDLADPCLEESANLYLGQLYHWFGDYRAATELLGRNVAIVEPELRRRGLRVRQDVNARTFLAWCLAELGEFAPGRAHADQARALAEASGSAYAAVHAYSGAGLLHCRQGEFGAAVTAAGRALELCQGRDFSAVRAIPASILGLAYAFTGRPGEAIALLEDSVKDAAALGAPVLTFLGEAYLVAGRVDAAYEAGSRAVDMCAARQERGWEAWALRLMAEVAAGRPSPEVATAEESYRRACAVAEELGMQPLVGRCHLGLAELYRKIGVSEPAERHRDVAMGLFDGLGMPFWLDRAKGDYNAGP